MSPLHAADSPPADLDLAADLRRDCREALVRLHAVMAVLDRQPPG